MLGKLMNYELRATGRVMLPGFGIVVLLAGLTRLSTAFLTERSGLLGTLGILITLLFGFACAGIGILALVIMIQRFRDSLLGDQGYLTHTLPVTTASNIFAKLLTSVIWYFGTAVIGVLAAFILIADQKVFAGLLEFLGEIFTRLPFDYAANGFGWAVEAVLLITAALSAFSLVIYASMALGYRAGRGKGLISVLIFFGFNLLTQIAGGVAGTALSKLDIRLPELGPNAEIHVGMLIGILACVLYGTVFYFVTAYNLKHHLNLE